MYPGGKHAHTPAVFLTLEYTVGGYSHPMDLPHALARRAFRGTYDKLRALITNKRLVESTAVGPHN